MPEEPSSDALFAVGGDVYGWDDVVAFARRRGDWDDLAARVGAGMAALADAEPDEEEVDAAARQFRYERNLLAADELADWLERHRLTAEDWRGYLVRSLARDRVTGAAAVASEDESAVWAEGICSGRLQQLAQELARLVAVSPGSSPGGLEAGFERFSSEAVDETAETREVEANRLEWMRFRYDAAVAGDQGAGQELVLCVRADGESLAAAAARAGLEVEQDDCWLDELEPALATRFLAAAPGELVGPVAIEGGFVVAHVISKTAPDLADEAVRARAHDAALERAVSRLVSDRVVWS